MTLSLLDYRLDVSPAWGDALKNTHWYGILQFVIAFLLAAESHLLLSLGIHGQCIIPRVANPAIWYLTKTVLSWMHTNTTGGICSRPLMFLTGNIEFERPSIPPGRPSRCHVSDLTTSWDSLLDIPRANSSILMEQTRSSTQNGQLRGVHGVWRFV